MVACPSCGQENPDGFRLCGMCGASLAAPGPSREERKVVTILFTDLVGSTARAEGLDPEDVRATLSSYYARLRAELERYGGTVETFIGDVVMAVFGAAVAHEDDPERAVRAALAIRDSIGEDLEIRTAVNTGEAVVALGARTVEGEGMVSGDVVNTAARLQSAAPVNGILVGETTFRATRHVIDYRGAPAVEAKGKAEPVTVWAAVAARSRFGSDVEQRLRTPLVGRERERSLLADAFERARTEESVQLVTLVGVPGSGIGSPGTLVPSSVWRERRRPTATRRSRPGAGCSRRRRSSGRWCSSSRTSTGPTTGCSTSSTTSPTGRRPYRCSSSARHDRSCSTGVRAGAAASGTPSRSRSARSRTRRRPSSSSACSTAPSSTPMRSRRCCDAPKGTRSTRRSTRACSRSTKEARCRCPRRSRG